MLLTPFRAEPCVSQTAFDLRRSALDAGLPCLSGDGFPLAMLAVYDALTRAVGRAPERQAREYARALAVTLHAAESMAPSKLGEVLTAEFAHLVSTAGLPLSVLNDHTPTLRHADTHPLKLMEYAALAVREWTALPQSQDVAGRGLIAPLALLVVGLTRAVHEAGEDPYLALCAADPDTLLLPERPAC